MYIFRSVAIHLLGINTKSTELHPNFTGFKLVSSGFRFEQIKTTRWDLRIYQCDILEVSGKDDDVLVFFV